MSYSIGQIVGESQLAAITLADGWVYGEDRVSGMLRISSPFLPEGSRQFQVVTASTNQLTVVEMQTFWSVGIDWAARYTLYYG